jgi:hypothetical protein
MTSFFKLQKTSSRLFLICPTWHLEQKLRQEFGENSYFMTALAGLFSFDDAQLLEISSLIKEGKIDKICLVANPNCRFITNIFSPDKFHNTATEDLLARIYHKKYDSLNSMNSLEDKKKALALYKSEMQLALLKRNPIISNLINHHTIDISIIINHQNVKSEKAI